MTEMKLVKVEGEEGEEEGGIRRAGKERTKQKGGIGWRRKSG